MPVARSRSPEAGRPLPVARCGAAAARADEETGGLGRPLRFEPPARAPRIVACRKPRGC